MESGEDPKTGGKYEVGNNSGERGVYSQFPSESRISAILQHCLDGFNPVTPLICTVAPRSTLYRDVKDLITNGWLESDGKDGYRTTVVGAAELRILKGMAPRGLVAFYSPLALVPTPQHRAAVELTIASVIARRFEVRYDRHPTIVLAGETLRWKTSAAIFLCYMLELDPAKHIINLAAESGKSLWLRKSSTGEIAYERELLKAPLLVLDEYQASQPDVRRLVSIFIDGRKKVSVENEIVNVEPVAFITLNPRDGDSLEEQLGLNTAQLRRCIPCNLAAIKVPDLALKGEEPITAAQAMGPLLLRKPNADCSPYKEVVYELLKDCLNARGRELVDLDMLLMLSTAMTAYFPAEEAILLVLFDALLLFETVGWTVPNWMHELSSSSFSDGRQVPSTHVSKDQDRDEIYGSTWSEAFKLLDDETNDASALVTKLHLHPAAAEKIAKRYHELMAQKLLRLEHDLKERELVRRATELEVPSQTEQRLEDIWRRLEWRNITEEQAGKEKDCFHNKGGYCRTFSYKEEPIDLKTRFGAEIEFKRIRSTWHFKASSNICGPCPRYESQSLYWRFQSLENWIGNLLDDGLLTYKCKCGASGLVAMHIKCTKCYKDSWWGWVPKA